MKSSKRGGKDKAPITRSNSVRQANTLLLFVLCDLVYVCTVRNFFFAFPSGFKYITTWSFVVMGLVTVLCHMSFFSMHGRRVLDFQLE